MKPWYRMIITSPLFCSSIRDQCIEQHVFTLHWKRNKVPDKRILTNFFKSREIIFEFSEDGTYNGGEFWRKVQRAQYIWTALNDFQCSYRWNHPVWSLIARVTVYKVVNDLYNWIMLYKLKKTNKFLVEDCTTQRNVFLVPSSYNCSFPCRDNFSDGAAFALINGDSPFYKLWHLAATVKWRCNIFR